SRFLPRTFRYASNKVVSPLRGSNRPRKRITGTSRGTPGGGGACGLNRSRSIPFGRIVQFASKYRLSAIVVECDTAIAADSLSSFFWRIFFVMPYRYDLSK